LGKKRVRVLRLEWLTLLPDWTAIPVSSQRRDIAQLPLNETEYPKPDAIPWMMAQSAEAAQSALASRDGGL
jgi:hypothetical protein